MSAVIDQHTWNAGNTVPQTKFRPPRLRRDVLARPALLARLQASIADNPITLVCAPGGSGKTTLLAQMFAQTPRSAVVVWLSIDAEENDSNRLFAALIHALQPLGLKWDVDPLSLIEHVGGTRAQTRAALAGLVNALCTSSAERIVIVLDDLHRIEKVEPLQLLDSLIERLPDHVAVVLGSRVEPELSLAKWRAYGELGAFTPTDLRFTEEEAIALAAARFGDTIDERVVHEALAQTRGWAAGLMLLLQSKATFEASASTDVGESNRHLFAYLAQEVLNDLPADLQDFVLRTSILIELNPALCTALTNRSDAAAVLDDLYRRNLFLTAVDESIPILRFHDLFREFLESDLARRDPALKQELHVQAANAESVPSRAIYHLLVAERWDEAMQRIAQAGEERLAHGAITTVERWIDTIPESQRASHPMIAYLRGCCAWYRWDWLRAKDELARAVEGLTAPQQRDKRIRAMLNLVDSLNSGGLRDAARARVDEASRWQLDQLGKAELAIQQSWCAMASGDLQSVVLYARDFMDIVAGDPAQLCPGTAERIHCVIIGIPGIADVFERFFTAYQQVRGAAALPWHISALTVGSWAHLWRGRRVEAQATLARAEQLQHQFGGIRLVIERLGQVKSLSGLMLGQHEAVLSTMNDRINGMNATELASHRASWLRPYRHALARAYWLLGDRAGYAEVLPYLTAPLMPGEWPFVTSAAATARGMDALFAKNWRTAEQAFREALPNFERFRVPMVYPDARINLAFALLQQGKKQDAWSAFESAYDEVINEHALGLFLLESREVINELLEIAPASVRQRTSHAGLLDHWRQWTESNAQPSNAARGPLTELSEREIEVLAEVSSGASNKHIARKLDLSLHTVKRHIANILDKLECDSRGQAADLYRRHA